MYSVMYSKNVFVLTAGAASAAFSPLFLLSALPISVNYVAFS